MINLDAKNTIIHIVGDSVISFAIILTALIIMSTHFTILDPILTIILVSFIFFTTIPITKDLFYILMEARPLEIDTNYLKLEVSKVNNSLFINQLFGVERVICVHVFSLTLDKIIIEMKIISKQDILKNVKDFIRRNYDCFHLNIEVHKDENELL